MAPKLFLLMAQRHQVVLKKTRDILHVLNKRYAYNLPLDN